MSSIASAASVIFASSVRDLGCCSRATCIGMVDAPEMTLWFFTFCQAARAIEGKCTPECSLKLRSSVSSVVTTTLFGNVSGTGQKPQAS